MEPPYTGVEQEEFDSLESSIDQVTPDVRKADPLDEQAIQSNYEENYNGQNLPQNPDKWKTSKRVPEQQRLKDLHEKEGLIQITKTGAYIYDVEPSPQNSAASFRVGTFDGPYLQNPINGTTFTEVYGEETKIALFLDYEWQFFKKLGKLGIKAGSGIMYAQGAGIFGAQTYYNDGTSIQDAIEANETYNLFVFPNNIALIYRMQLWDKQWLVPFAEIGLDYLALIEYRDDGEETNFGGAPHFHFALGGSFLLNALSRDIGLTVDKEYGINAMWLTAEYRRLELITGDFDFSDDVFSAGFMFEF